MKADCLFRLEAYQIEDVAVLKNESWDATLPSHSGDVTTTITITPNKNDAAKYRLVLEVQIAPTPKKEKAFFPYRVAIKGRAFFAFTSPCECAEAEKALQLNGASILYGLLRAQVAQITAQSAHGQFLLPCLNFSELAKSQKESEAPKNGKAGAI